MVQYYNSRDSRDSEYSSLLSYTLEVRIIDGANTVVSPHVYIYPGG